MKPIIFSTPMVQAIQEGRKTQTRRVIKPHIVDRFVLDGSGRLLGSFSESSPEQDVYPTIDDAQHQPGDILWVRETWYYETHMEELTNGEPDLPSGNYSHRYIYKACSPDYPVNVGVGQQGWRPSIHMPREAARIYLEVTDVRVERVQEISYDSGDVWAEGIPATHDRNAEIMYFAALWDEINAKRGYGWDVNPWVWVYTFKDVSGEITKDANPRKYKSGGCNHAG